uniref:Uncharacterized protein n=1 Tax=Lepeophtheirus salmonis TaxID=72036 RepID=A0A0K2UUG2_LEPSM
MSLSIRSFPQILYIPPHSPITDIESLGMLHHRLSRRFGYCSVHVLHDPDFSLCTAAKGHFKALN